MPQALPFIGAGLSILSAVQGAGQQSKQNSINQDQLAQIARQQHLGRLLGKTGASGNPFSPVYAPAFDQIDAQANTQQRPSAPPFGWGRGMAP